MLITRADRTLVSKQVEAEVRAYFGALVYDKAVPDLGEVPRGLRPGHPPGPLRPLRPRRRGLPRRGRGVPGESRPGRPQRIAPAIGSAGQATAVGRIGPLAAMADAPTADGRCTRGSSDERRRRGGIPGPESRTGLVRPAMTEAEFERQAGPASADARRPAPTPSRAPSDPPAEPEPAARIAASPAPTRPAPARAKPAKPRRVQRMFAIEEDLDKKLWLYAIHVGKDRSEVVNDLLRPLVASMVLYDSRDRRAGRAVEAEGQGEAADS